MMHDRSELLPIHNLKEHKQTGKTDLNFKSSEGKLQNGGADQNQTRDRTTDQLR